MKNKLALISLAVVILLVLVIVFIFNKSTPKSDPDGEGAAIDLPLNTLALAERPYITLAPDSTGRSLDISLSGAPTTGELEYEMIYNAAGKQEGAIGSIFLATEKQPLTKAILLGSKSGGGKVTYHEGVTGGSLTVTYGETRLKESWNYLHFDPTDPVMTTSDARFSVTFGTSALKKDAVVITMKTFGYPKVGLPEGAKVVAGPYGYFPQTPIKGTASIEIKLPSGEHVSPTLYEYSGTSWKKLPTTLSGDTVSSTATGNVFLVTAE